MSPASVVLLLALSAIWLGERRTVRKAAGLVLGIAGVVLVSSMHTFERTPTGFLAVAACLLAPACCALAGIYVKRRASWPPRRR